MVTMGTFFLMLMSFGKKYGEEMCSGKMAHWTEESDIEK